MENVKDLTEKIEDLKKTKRQTKKDFKNRVQAIQDKLPHNYASFIAYTKGIDKKRVYRVKNGVLFDFQVLEALEELAK
jgi:acetyl-CoA carboxylase alpha subunit